MESPLLYLPAADMVQARPWPEVRGLIAPLLYPGSLGHSGHSLQRTRLKSALIPDQVDHPEAAVGRPVYASNHSTRLPGLSQAFVPTCVLE